MNKYKLEIMEMLGDLVDKELKLGCIVEVFNKQLEFTCPGGDVSEDEVIISEQYVYIDGESFYSERNGIEFFEEMGYDGSKGEINYVIGQYHLGTILRWIPEQHTRYVSVGYTTISFERIKTGELILLDLSKPPMERSEEEDKKLLAFMKQINE